MKRWLRFLALATCFAGAVLPAAAQRLQLGDAQAAAATRAAVLGVAGPVAAPVRDGWDPMRPVMPQPLRRYRVEPAAADGRTVFRTVQGAVNRAVVDLQAGPGNPVPVLIEVMPGDYPELVIVPPAPVSIRLQGLTADPREVRIHQATHSGMAGARYRALHAAVYEAPGVPAEVAAAYRACAARQTLGTFCSAGMQVRNDGFELRDLTVENDYDESDPGNQHQAVAFASDGADRVQLRQVRLLGNQDTLLLRSASPDRIARVFVHRSLVAGDVDFIFGNATAYFLDSEIRWVGAARGRQGGYLAAPSTRLKTPYGFVFEHCDFTAEPAAPAGSVKLARQWFEATPCSPYGDNARHCKPAQASTEAVGKMLVLRSWLGAHLDRDAPWADWNSDRGHRAYRKVQADTDAFWQQLAEAGHDPASLGYRRATPPEPFLAEYRNLGPTSATPQASLERSVLAEGDGWASAEGGTRGGADARPERVFDVRNRAELAAALAQGRGAPDEPRIVRVHGSIDLSTDDAGRSLGAEDYRDPAFDFEAYLRAYDPAVWGRKPPEGPLEEARRRSQQRQAERVVLRVPSRTTIVGVGAAARLLHGTLLLQEVSDVIVRNLAFEDAFDHFPAWDPNDNGHGEWNSEYDNLTLRRAHHVWIDHCSFSDGERPDSQARTALGQRMQHHDGLLDITQQSDFVTVSWSHFRNHDKTMLIGGSDGAQADATHLRVSLHHNLWENLKERMPRVRYGRVHVFNNLYLPRSSGDYAFAYAIGVGVESRIVAEHNAWEAPEGVKPTSLVSVKKGVRLAGANNLFNARPVDLREAAPSPLNEDAGWWPMSHGRIDAADEAARRVRAEAGAGHL
ncbi:pectinesterase family protein [Ideonella sp. BN130291]|uniref:pectinesterase family protein n=1 Tax=Ideonella sp. BN130291 TaxID=3112940 RepID=UPI002E266C1F|nr:pectinesterase family protein [Ideonella sp. BN130291]